MPDATPPEDDDPLERTVALEDLNHAMALALLAMGLDDPAADGRTEAVEQFRRDLLALGVTSVELDEAGIRATRTPMPAALAAELAERRRDATFAHRLAQRVRDDAALLRRIACTGPPPADLPDTLAVTVNRAATEPPEGKLIRFHTRAQGAVIGARFGDYYCSATTIDTWSAHFVTGWDPVMVLPDTEATVTRLVIAISEEVAAEWAQQPKDHPASHPRALQAALRKVAV